MIDYNLILVTFYITSRWSLNGSSYEGLDWLDSTPKPTQAELDALWGPLLAERARTAYIDLRAAEYPDYKLYLDGVVKGDQAQIQSYIDACQAVKAKYPKE
jgi:hypothetical protein